MLDFPIKKTMNYNSVLNFKIVVVNSYNDKHNCVGWERFNAFFEMHIFPLCNKVVFRKYYNLGVKKFMNLYDVVVL